MLEDALRGEARRSPDLPARYTPRNFMHAAMSAETDVQTRHLANLAGALVEAASDEGRTLERFDGLHGTATVAVDDRAADVMLHEKGVTVHVRFDE